MRHVAPAEALERIPLFEGLSGAELAELAPHLRERTFSPREEICRAGEPGTSMFVVKEGLARVVASDAEGRTRVVARLRRGDVVGEMSLLTDEPRSATVAAAVTTRVLELDREGFAAALAHSPRILTNLSRVLSRRLASTTAQVVEHRSRGEAVALVIGRRTGDAVLALAAATAAASARRVRLLDARNSLECALDQLDDALAGHATVLLAVDLSAAALTLAVDSADRALAVVGSADELDRLAGFAGVAHRGEQPLDAVVVAGSPEEAEALGAAARPGIRVVRAVSSPLSPDDAGWLGRYLSRTRLGLALGAGGAKGYAHVGALAVLEEAGYTVDCVAGSSIGAVVGAWLALGMSADEVEATMRHGFRPEVVERLFELSLSGTSKGVEEMARMLQETTGEKSFADLTLPLAVMTVDLDGGCPSLLTEGPLWEALLAATAVAGLFPPYVREGRRLVDGLALVPVPTDAVQAAGADLCLSIDLLGREALPSWPGAPQPPAEAGPTRRARVLDTILEVMDLAQADASRRHAARADVVVTPRFGPGGWRDFHLADRYLEAGRQAARDQLPALRALARPARNGTAT